MMGVFTIDRIRTILGVPDLRVQVSRLVQPPEPREGSIRLVLQWPIAQ